MTDMKGNAKQLYLEELLEHLGIDTKLIKIISNSDLDHILSKVDTEILLKLLDSRSTKIAETAMYILARQHVTNPVIKLIEENVLETCKGRMAALGLLQMFGAACPDAIRAYRHALNDPSYKVLDQALFGVIFMCDTESLPTINLLLADSKPGSNRHEVLTRAKRALESNNPHIFVPSFVDLGNRWKLDT